MRTNRLGCFTIPGLLIAVMALILITGITWVRGGTLFSPGALNAQGSGQTLGQVSSHAEITHCSNCHTAPWASQRMSDRCLDCHVNISEGKDWHILMYNQGLTSTCQSCHTDHHGSLASLTDVSLANFPHHMLGFSLSAHLLNYDQSSFACTNCHQDQLSTIELSVCVDCHQAHNAQFMGDHMAAFGADCLACHDGLDTYGHQFDHDQLAFPLSGQHRQLSCGNCHAGARSISEMQAVSQECAACHQKDEPHEGRFGQDCAACHTVEGWKPAEFDHRLADFQLVGKHVEVECQKCHVTDAYRETPQDCFSCHTQDDPHQGKLGQDCSACHTLDGWKPANFDHSTAAFLLLGKHAQAVCQDCHSDLIFKGTPQDCYSCHAKDDAHGGQLGPDCVRCHVPDGWKPSTFDHSMSVFPLTGKHIAVVCKSCHQDLSFKGTPQVCVACHSKVDAHAGQFGTDCAQCHSTAGWKPATFDHSRAAFPLTGAHVSVACKSCHTGGSLKARLKIAFLAIPGMINIAESSAPIVDNAILRTLGKGQLLIIP